MQNIMIPNEYNNIFDKLNSAQHATREYNAMSIWPNDVPNKKITITAPEFWFLNDVLGTVKNLDTETYQYQSTIGNILREYAPKEMLPNEKFKLFDKHIYVINIGTEKITAEISRYAAWAIMKEIGKHDDTTFHQEYFLSANPNPIQIFERVRHISRITERERVKTYQKTINGILSKDLHSLPTYMASFYTNLSACLFGGMPTQSIQKHYHISDNRPLADYMNAELITKFATTLETVVSRYHNAPHKSYDNLYQITTQEMKALRKLFIDKRDTPEANICTVSSDDVKADREKREQAFINKYIHEKVR